MRSRPVVLALVLLGLGAGAPAHAAAGPVPASFLGVVADGPVLEPSFDLPAETALMARSGVGAIRAQFGWAGAQPYKSFDQVPDAQKAAFVDEGGVPTSYAATDRVVAAAAAQRLPVLPVVQYAPGWAALKPGVLASPPSSPQAYARYLSLLVRRYGPKGSFWTANPQLPKVPIRRWQVWNEPELRYQWSEQPWSKRYRTLLRGSRTAIKRADRGAQVVLAAFTNFSWKTLDLAYRRRMRGLFDVVAIHPYTAEPKGVLTIARRARRVMDRRGDRRVPLLLTEVGWPSAEGVKSAGRGLETTERGQADRLAAVLPLLARARKALKLQGVFVYTWMGREVPDPPTTFDYAGLRKVDANGVVSDKPALTAFRSAAQALRAP